jgi:hypothetical protein
MTILTGLRTAARNTVQKLAQPASATTRQESEETQMARTDQDFWPDVATCGSAGQACQAPRAGLEPTTLGLEIPCSIRLSYRGLRRIPFLRALPEGTGTADL